MMSQRATFQTGVGVSKLSFSMEAVNRWLKMFFLIYTLGRNYSYKKQHQKQRFKNGFKYGTSRKQNTYFYYIMINTFVYFFMLSTCEDGIFMKRDSSVRKRRLSSGAVWEQQESKEPL